MNLSDTQWKAIIATVFGGSAALITALPVPDEWKPVAVAASALIGALATLIDPNRAHAE